jgi:uncharacterized HAD superfamily protein
MKIGIDLDEVVVDFLTPFNKYIKEKTGLRYTKESYFSFNFQEVLNLPRSQIEELYKGFHTPRNFQSLPPIGGALESLLTLAGENEIYFITARHLMMQKPTKEWLYKNLNSTHYKLIHSSNIPNRGNGTKSQICKKKKILLMLEDNAFYARECADSEVRVLLFDKPWNKKVKHRNIKRVYNWPHALETIQSQNT